MNPDKPASDERMKKWREQKKQTNRDKVKACYEKNKAKISQVRKANRLQKRSTGCSSNNEDLPFKASSQFSSRTAKKRALEKARNALPQSPRKRVEVLKSLLDSPTTSKCIDDSVLKSPEQQEVRLAKAIIQDVSSVLQETKNKRSDGARTTMRVGLSMLCGPHIAGGNMRKSLGEALNISRRRIAMSVAQETSVMCNKEKLWALTKRKTRCDAISDEHKQLAQDFWGSPGISRTTGNKNDVKKERVAPKQYVYHEKQVLEKTQTEAYEEFKLKYPDIKMGQRAFEKCKPFFVIEARPKDRESCCCRSHVEIRMLFKSCMGFRRELLKRKSDNERETYPPVYEHLSDVVNETVCNGGRLECVNRECEECGVTNLKLMPEEEDVSPTASDVKWQRFEYVEIAEKRRLKIVIKSTKVGEMYSYFKTLLHSFSGHQFRAKWQHEQMKRSIEHLPIGHVCCVHDYSENYSCQYQDQPQTLYFSQTQVSIHVTVMHRHAIKEIDGIESSLEKREIVTEHLFVISPDVKHDHDSVHECRSIVANYLREIEYPVTIMHEWTDGCAAQYKSCHCMGDLSFSVVDFGFVTLRNYFETSHAKGPQDGAGANLKHKTDMAVIRRQVLIQNARDLFEYAHEHLTEPSSTRYKSQSVGLKRRLFFYVDEHRRDRRRRFKQIKGSRLIHSVMATDDQNGSKIEHRHLSCYCDSCLDGDYDQCENCEWVEAWREIEMEQEGFTRRVTRSEVEDQQVRVKDLVTEGSVVAIASGDPGEDYYLLKVTGQASEQLKTLTKDDWGSSYPPGAEVICGHFLLPIVGSRHQYKEDSKKAIVYSATARFLCTDLCSFPDGRTILSDNDHEDILNSLEGF